jgi:hypothetical protein
MSYDYVSNRPLCHLFSVGFWKPSRDMGTDLSGKVSPFLSSCSSSNLRIAGDRPESMPRAR